MPVNGRFAAYTALMKWETKKIWPMDSMERLCLTDGREGALGRRICLTVLQNTILLDETLKQYLSVPLPKLDKEILCILRLSAAQLLFMDKIPAHAAVSEGVELCTCCGKKSAGSLVNAVLRRVSEHKGTLPPLPSDPVERLSVLTSHPLWLTKRFCQILGQEKAEKALLADNTEPESHLMVHTRRTDRDTLLGRLGEEGFAVSPHPWLEDGIVLSGGGNLTESACYQEGLFYVQDAAAHCAVWAADIREGDTVLDGCAAPGGKTVAAAISAGKTGRVLAFDLAEKKLKKIRENAERLRLPNISVARADGRIYLPEYNGIAHVVLADVPCSGLGVIRKKPEIRTKGEEEIAGLPAIQLSILENLSRYVAPGGTLVYSTCTILPEENRQVVSAFLQNNPQFQPSDFTLPTGRVSQAGCITFYQGLDGTDGFFLCRLRRNEEKE